jgi:hypothetical protein
MQTRNISWLLKLEEAALLAVSIAGILLFEAPWWCWLLLLVGPDISMIGYIFGNKAGAFCYNLFHHKAIAVLLGVAGIVYSQETLIIAGFIIFGHSSLDRMLGFGLKTSQGFSFTHLGKIGKGS